MNHRIAITLTLFAAMTTIVAQPIRLHPDNPRWFESMGAFEHPDCVPIFLRFVERVVAELGDLVEDWPL